MAITLKPKKKEVKEEAKALAAEGVGLRKKPTKAEEKAKLEVEKIALEEERVYRKGIASIKDLIAPSSMKVEPGFLRLGDILVRTLFIVTYPRYVSVGWASPIINLSAMLDISMFFYPIKSDVILKQLKKKVGILEAQIQSSMRQANTTGNSRFCVMSVLGLRCWKAAEPSPGLDTSR